MVVVFAAYTVGLEYHFRMKAFNLNTMDLDYSQWLDNQFLIQQYNNVPDDVYSPSILTLLRKTF